MEIAPVDRFVVSEERALGLKFGHSVISLSHSVNAKVNDVWEFGEMRSVPPCGSRRVDRKVATGLERKRPACV